MKEVILSKIKQVLPNSRVDIVNQSHLHAGHAGVVGGNGETHFDLIVISQYFEGLSKIARHRKIYEILSQELQSQIHALSIKTYSESEYNSLT